MKGGLSPSEVATSPAPVVRAWLTPGKSRFAKALSWSLAAHAVSRLVMLVAGMEVSRRIGVQAFADFTMFIVSLNLLAAFADLGGSIAVMKYSVVSRTEGRREEGLALLAASQQVSLVLAGGVFVVMLLTTRAGTWPAWQIAALGLAGLVACLQSSFASVLVALRELRQVFIANLAFALIVVVGTAVAAWQRDLTTLIWALPLGYALQCAVQAVVMRRELPISLNAWLRPNLPHIGKVLGLMGFLAPTSALASSLPWLTANLQQQAGTDTLAVATFGASMTLFGMILTIPSRMAQLFFIDQVETNAAGAGAMQIVRSDLRAMALAAGSAALCVFGLVAVAPWLLGWYGADIAAHVDAIVALVSVGVVAITVQVLGNRIVAADRPAIWLAVTTLQAAVVLSILLVRPVSAIWLPAAAYWAGYGAAFVAGVIGYVAALRKPRA